jgi:hypothetical protein
MTRPPPTLSAAFFILDLQNLHLGIFFGNTDDMESLEY